MTHVRTRTTVVAAIFTATLGLAPAISSAQNNRLIINRGASPQATVTLSPDSNVSIDAVTGNVVVDCAANVGDPTQCADSLGGGGTPPPAFSIAASQFSAPAVDGRYPPLTTFNLAPVGTLHSSYEACQRITTGATGQTNWSGFVPPAGAGGVVTLPNPDSSYNFALRCFADGGARTSNLLNVLSGTGVITGPGNCPSGDQWPGQGWSAFGRSAERRFTDLRRPDFTFSADFPHTGGLALFGVNRAEYLSVEFTAIPKIDANGDGLINIQDFPSFKFLNWLEAQGGLGAAGLDGVFFSISRCPGDFRLPPSNNIPDPDEPTLNLGCRNIRLEGTTRSISSGIEYSINSAPNNSTCALAYGAKYYLNFMTVNPLDGYQPNEHNCIDATPRCGVQFRSQ